MSEDTFQVVAIAPSELCIDRRPVKLPALPQRALPLEPGVRDHVVSTADREEARRALASERHNAVLMPGPLLPPELQDAVQLFAARTVATRFFEPRPLPALRAELAHVLRGLEFAGGDRDSCAELAELLASLVLLLAELSGAAERNLYCQLQSVPYLEAVEGTRKFHIDTWRMSLNTALVGPGTEFVANDSVDRERLLYESTEQRRVRVEADLPLPDDGAAIRADACRVIAPTGALLLMKGELREPFEFNVRNALVHRVPEFRGPRLMFCTFCEHALPA
jgi:Protein of unknown function (DUF1826)